MPDSIGMNTSADLSVMLLRGGAVRLVDSLDSILQRDSVAPLAVRAGIRYRRSLLFNEFHAIFTSDGY